MKRIMMLITSCFSLVSLAQECDDPIAISEFGINEIHVRLGQGGNFWNATQEGWAIWLPQQEGSNLLYTSGLIVAGISPNQQLKLAGAGYAGNGSDYFAGPLSVNGEATTDMENCLNWDRFFTVYEQHVSRHRAYFECLEDPDCDINELFPFGYVIPESFLEYPAHGDVALDQDFNLAPFYDHNSDGLYNPLDGDAPYFNSVYGEGDCCESLKGHVCAFWITNDKGGSHSYSNAEPIGLEIWHMTYAYAAGNYLGRTIFHNEKFINRGTQTLSDTYIGHFIDPDLGSPNDDLFGSDSTRQAVFVYNGDDYDEPTLETASFESRIPATAWVQLRGPWEDADGIDGDNDGVVDNETLRMNHVIGTDVGIFPNFSTPVNFYQYLQSYMSNGAHYLENQVPKDFQWESPIETPEIWGDIAPNDVKIIASTGPFTLQPRDSHCLTHAFTYSRPNEDAPALTALADLGPQVDSLHFDFETCFSCVPPTVNIQVEEISPGVYSFFNVAGADEYEWDFGDATVSNFAFPTHTYGADNTFIVSLEVSNACGSAYGEVEVNAIATNVAEEVAVTGIKTFPNPAKEAFTISGLGKKKASIRIYNAHGQLVWERASALSQVQIPTTGWRPGLHAIIVRRDSETYRLKVAVE